ncbi:hypothetical protein C6352_30140 [Bacillus thuringiensis]|nr:hypothetical protein C6352_30140 [Bacillus thuringiensis]
MQNEEFIRSNIKSGQIKTFRSITNKEYTNFIIKYCLKHNCGRIQTELLKGILKNAKVLKDWTYFDLQ